MNKDVLSSLFNQEELDTIIANITLYSPIPRNTIDSLDLLISNYESRKEDIIKFLKNGESIKVISRILGYSIYLRNIINENIDLLFDTIEKINQPFSVETITNEIESLMKDFKNDKNSFLKWLRNIKRREFLRIVSKELIGIASFEQTCKDLSLLADVVLNGILKFNFQRLSEAFGVPSSEFCVISLGKLGGLELNYSSDIDIIFVYEDDGKTEKGIENVEFFDKLAREVIYDISSSINGEFLYRVDTRLRPDGEFGALVRKEESYYTYYTERAQIWEIQMLIKARFSSGDESLGKRFVENIKNIVFSTPLTDSEIAEILGIKKKIKGNEYDLKKMTGGIRDIEFIVQLLQLIFGIKETTLRVQNTLLAIERLEKVKVIDEEVKRVLEQSYKNLRRLENYIQLYNNFQEFSLPINDGDRMIGLYRLLMYGNVEIRGNENQNLITFVDDIKKKIVNVKAYVFEKLLDIKAGEEVIFFLYNSEEKEVRELLSSYGLKETSRAFSFLESIISSSFRGGIETSIGLRNLLRAVSNSPLPDKSISNIYYILESTQNLPISIQFFTDKRNVNFIFNVSLLKDTFINILRKRNWIWDGMMDTNAFMDYLPIFLNRINFSKPNYLDSVREVYEVFTTSLSFLRINKFIDSNKTKELLSTMFDKIFVELSKIVNGNLTTLALGRWANRKLTFFSDVDLIYIIPYDIHSDEFFTIRDMVLKMHNEFNNIFQIDTRLVEGSHKGSFIISLKTLENSNFDIWQTIAYLKSRPVSCSESFKDKIQNIIIEKITKSVNKMNFRELNNFIKKVISSFSNEDDLKKGRGNLLELELILDKLYFKHFNEFDEVMLARSLSEMSKILEKVVKIPVPIRDYLFLLVEVEDMTRIVEGIGFEDKIFQIANLPIKFSDFKKIRSEIVNWCNEVIEQE